MFIPNEVLILLGNVAMAVWGAVIRYLFMLTKREHDSRFLLAGIASATFLGLAVFLSYDVLGLSTKLSLVASGILGYTGPDAIDVARRVILFKKFGLKRDDYEDRPETGQSEEGKRG
jgi:hypothetical protein